ncbi:unnamed protein product [Ilex paraguariensis]|uniref:Uncharacterized protein n=1 Tax=Ilex paraguariensis TaxID=185542 RepID=A0ABC8RTE2_9AQUA
MDPEVVMNLFDSCWFSFEIFKKQSHNSDSSNPETNPDHKTQENPSESKLSSLPTIHMRSKSDQLSSFNSDFLSPNSVLFTPHLQTILSGKEVMEEEPRTEQHIEEFQEKRETNMRRRTKKKMSKSLSELEFEEIKGFMDLGFVFSEEDKVSSLVEILPGLQRLGKRECEQREITAAVESSVPRPYLSESWEDLDRRQREHRLINWRVPDLSNEIGIKDSLKWWAHTVASTVR